MKLFLLGTAGYHPNDCRQTSCMLIPECGIMLDAGTGAYRAARLLPGDELDVFLTHAHLDHVVGLTYLLEAGRIHPMRRITVHGLAKTLAAIDEHLLDEVLFPKRPPFELRPLAEMSLAWRRRPVDVVPAGPSGRQHRVPARLARSCDGLRHRHDGHGRRGLCRAGPRSRSSGPRVLSFRRRGGLRPADRSQPAETASPSWPASPVSAVFC